MVDLIYSILVIRRWNEGNELVLFTGTNTVPEQRFNSNGFRLNQLTPIWRECDDFELIQFFLGNALVGKICQCLTR